MNSTFICSNARYRCVHPRDSNNFL